MYVHSFDNAIVQIFVGPEKQLFNLHKKLLCDVSSHFKAAFEGKFMEAESQRIEMPGEDAATFKFFQLWLYSKDIPVAKAKGDKEGFNWAKLTRLYIFAEVRGISDLQNDAVYAFIDQRINLVKVLVRQIQLVYADTSDKSPLRKLLVDWTVHYCHNDKEDSHSWFSEKIRQ